jgi:hypothetical protein
MAAFATLAEAEARCKLKMAQGVWVVAHSERMFNGTIACRVIRYMSGPPPAGLTEGGWVDITDNVVN